MREFIFLTIANHLPRLNIFDRARPTILRFAGIKIGSRSTIFGPLIIRPTGCAKNIEIGSGAFLSTEIRFSALKDKVIIGNNVLIGPRVMFETGGHGLRYKPGVGRGTTTKPIQIEDEVWVGAGVIVLQGVTIGRGSVIAAGAVVTKNVEPNTLVGGVPAKFIRMIDDESL